MPLVLLDKVTRQHRSPQVIFIEPGQLCNQRLAERSNSYGVVNRRGHVADTEFDGTKKWMRGQSWPV